MSQNKIQSLIINADDLGMNHQVNCAIEEQIRRGLITSSTILANGDAVEEAVVIALRNTNASYGVHLYIDQLPPLTNIEIFNKYGMLGRDGRFIPFAYQHIKRTEEVKEAIYNEWKAQIDKIMEAGVPITHLDSHHHAHCNPFLTPLYIRIAREYGIKRIRLAMYTPICIKLKEKRAPVSLDAQLQDKNPRSSSKVNHVVKSLKTYWELSNANKLIKKGFDTTDYFCSYRYYINNKILLTRFRTIEIMVHPGHPSYQEETEQLELLKAMSDIKLIRY